MTTDLRRVAALALPVVALVAMVVRAELVVHRGREYVLDIEGYDPRDLLRGQYLRYRVKWNGPATPCADASAECFVCIRAGASASNPAVTEVGAWGLASCGAAIRRDALDNLREYFIPEGRGPALEAVIRERRASVRVSVSSDHDAIVEDLLVDGEPWRTQVKP
jgi:hypothetical protein